MKVKIKRIDKELPLPVYETHGSVGFDLIAREDTRVHSGAIELVPANIIIEVPDGYMLMLASRSSTPRKKGVMQPYGIGIIDLDYCGPEDEIKIQIYNFTEEVQEIKRGDKIAQGVFVKIDKPQWEEVEEMTSETRGGFGSTGGHL